MDLSKGSRWSAPAAERSLWQAGVGGGEMGPFLGAKVAMVSVLFFCCAGKRLESSWGGFGPTSHGEAAASLGVSPSPTSKQWVEVVVLVGGEAQKG